MSRELSVIRFRAYHVSLRGRHVVRVFCEFTGGRTGVVLDDGMIGFVSEAGIQGEHFVQWITDWTDVPPEPVDIWANIGCGG